MDSNEAREIVEIRTDDILDAIERNEPIYYTGATIIGDLNIKSRSEKLAEDEAGRYKIESEIIIKKCIIKGIIDFKNSVFKERVNFNGSWFKDDVSFNNTYFMKIVDFSANFEGKASFADCNFDDDANFGSDAQFYTEADFTNSTFNGIANFYKTKFKGDVRFGRTHFKDYIDFNDAEFDGDNFTFEKPLGHPYFILQNIKKGSTIDYKGYTIVDNMNPFSEALDNWDRSIKTKLEIKNSEIQGIFDMSEIIFERPVNFNGTKFNKDVILKNSEFRAELNFVESVFNGDLILENSRIHEIILLGSKFQNNSKISLINSEFAKLDANWDDIKNNLIYNNLIYLSLAKNFRDLDRFDDADDCYYRYRRKSQSEKSWEDWTKYLDISSWISCGYGVRLSYTIIVIILLILIFGVLYWMSNFVGGVIGSDLSESSFFEFINLSTEIFLYNDFNGLHSPWIYVARIESLFKWIVSGLFVVVLTRKLIR